MKIILLQRQLTLVTLAKPEDYIKTEMWRLALLLVVPDEFKLERQKEQKKG